MRWMLGLVFASCNLVVGDYKVDVGDGGVEGSEGGTDAFHDVTDASFWQSFDVASVVPGAGGFTGGAFDGKFVYFAPFGIGVVSGLVVRYEIAKGFTDSGAWTSFDMKMIDPNAAGYSGAVFASGAVYFVPSQGASSANSLVMRYDTSQAFNSATSWAKLDLTTINAGAKGYFGGIFDGQYLVLAPSFDGVNAHGLVARYDTTHIFTQSASWSIWDFKQANMNAIGFTGAVADGQTMYMVPLGNNTAVRFKPNAVNPLIVSTFFDITMIDQRARLYIGGGVQNGHVYLAPGSDSLVLRVDVTKPFDMRSSWEVFDHAGITSSRGYSSTAIDGRYMYFAPYRRQPSGARNGTVLRYDGTAEFGQSSSWQTFDTTTLSPPASGFEGAIFDGKYVYFAPHLDGIVARFDAKNIRSLPPGYSGSFL
jgi:hypothetical protein